MLGLFLYSLNLIVSFFIVFILFLLSPVIPRRTLEKIYDFMTRGWVNRNRLILKLTTRTKLTIIFPKNIPLESHSHYLVIANHQTWADILILFNVFSGKIPMLKFFLKNSLKWVPIVGQICWMYGFPFLHRNKNKNDLHKTREACARFKDSPGSLMIFPEGTRFTVLKQQKQHSPYRHLLKPKSGGILTALQCLEGKIKYILDTTIIYHPQKSARLNFWNFCKGNINEITVIITAIPCELNSEFLKPAWDKKDQLLHEYVTK